MIKILKFSNSLVLKSHFLLFVVLILLQGCAIEKRHYSKGYNVEWNWERNERLQEAKQPQHEWKAKPQILTACINDSVKRNEMLVNYIERHTARPGTAPLETRNPKQYTKCRQQFHSKEVANALLNPAKS